MNRVLLFLICAMIVALSPAAAQQFFVSSGGAKINLTQAVPNFMFSGGEFAFLNRMKEASSWTYFDNSTRPNGNELDANGDPIYCIGLGLPRCAFSGPGGMYKSASTPTQFEKPGHYVITWTGAGDLTASQTGVSVVTNVSCAGTSPASNECSNTACTPMTASIAGTALTVTSPPGGTGSCATLVQGQPISGAGVAVGQFGMPTIITSAGSACGGNTCYTVNISQTVPSESMNPGGRFEFSVNGATEPQTLTNSQLWNVRIVSTGTSGNQSNTAQHIGFYHVNDEATYWTGQLASPDFKTAFTYAHPGYIRNLNFENSVVNNCPTWADRKPGAYTSYYSDEFRANIYGSGSNDNIHPNYALNGSINQYSVTNLGSALPADKQEVLVQWGNATSSGTFQFSIDGGTTYYPILNSTGAAFNGTIQVNHNDALMFDAALGGWLEFNETGGSLFPTATALACGVPPEAFVEFAHEINAYPWFVEYYTAADPISDFDVQTALYVQKTFPGMVPAFETPNENWNPCCNQAGYLGNKAHAWYLTGDAAWGACSATGSAGCTNQEAGKMASLLGQAISSVFGGNKSKYRVVQGLWTNQAYGGVQSFINTRLTSAEYVAQNTGLIPAQTGCAGPGALQASCPNPFLLAPAYSYINEVAQTTYWGPAFAGAPAQVATGSGGSPVDATQFSWETPAEISAAYNYWNAASPSAAAAVMTSYMASSTTPGGWLLSIGDNATIASAFDAWATTCADAQSPSNCPIKNVIAYEGGFQNSTYSWIQDSFVSSVQSNASPCVLNMNRLPPTALPGQIVSWQGSGGGAWNAINNMYFQITAISGTQITINLDCTSFGAISANAVDLLIGVDATAQITGSNNGSGPCNLSTSISFTGSITPGGGLSLPSNPPGTRPLLFGSTLTGTGISGGTTITAIHGVANGGAGSYGITPSNQTVGSETMTASNNGAVAGMTVGIVNAVGGTWSTINGNTYTVQSGGTASAIPINLDCSGLGTLTSATLVYVGSFNQINYLKAQSYISPDLFTQTQNGLQNWFNNGLTEASQFNIGGNNSQATFPYTGGSPGSGDPWFAISTDLYGWFASGLGQGTISGSILTLTGAVYGKFAVGQTLIGTGVTGVNTGAGANTTITGSAVNSATCGGSACTGTGGAGTYLLSQASTISSLTALKGGVQGYTSQWAAYKNWNISHGGGYLLKRDLSPASNDNSPAWLNEAA